MESLYKGEVELGGSPEPGTQVTGKHNRRFSYLCKVASEVRILESTRSAASKTSPRCFQKFRERFHAATAAAAAAIALASAAQQPIIADDRIHEVGRTVAAALCTTSDVCARQRVTKHLDQMSLKLASGPAVGCNSDNKHCAPTDPRVRVHLPSMSWVVSDANVKNIRP